MAAEGDEIRLHYLGCTQHLEISEPWQVWKSTCGFRLAPGSKAGSAPQVGSCPRRTVVRCRGLREILGARYRKARFSGFTLSMRKFTGSFGPSPRVHIRLLELSQIPDHPDPRVKCMPVRGGGDDPSIMTNSCINH